MADPQKNKEPDFTGKRIWVVEDETSAQHLIRDVLQSYGATVETFGHQLDAAGRLMKLREKKDPAYPDLVVTDATYAPTPKVKDPFRHREEDEMPRAGQELIKMMSENTDPRIRKIPIILLSGWNFKRVSFPNTTILSKPAGMGDLPDVIQRKLFPERGR